MPGMTLVWGWMMAFLDFDDIVLLLRFTFSTHCRVFPQRLFFS